MCFQYVIMNSMVNSSQLRLLLERGVSAFRSGDTKAAKAAFERALAVAPGDPDALNLYGATLLQSGDAPSALEYLQRAVQQKRNDPSVVGNLAQAYFLLERYDEACEAFLKASRLDPHALQFALGVANSLAMQGRLEAAEHLLEKLSGRFSESSLVWFNLGNVQRDRQLPADALASFRRAAQLDSHNVDARNSLGCMLHASLQFEEAEREYRACLNLAPDFFLARCNLASVVMDLGRFDEAAQLCRDVINRAPALPLAHSFLGAALAHQGRLIDALNSHAKSARLAPRDGKICQSYAAALADCGKFMLALEYFNRALSLAPGLDSTHQLLGFALLGHGCFTEGWSEYIYRPWADVFRSEHPNLKVTKNLPTALLGKHVVVIREQGLGDEIFFLRYAPQLHAAGARVTYCASPKIHTLLARSSCFDRVVAEIAPPADADEILLVGDLPHALSEAELCSFPLKNAVPISNSPKWAVKISIYWPQVPMPLPLAPLAERIAEIRERLAKAGPGPYTGLTWRGGTPPDEQRAVIWVLYKEIGITQFASALQEARGTFIAVQRTPQAGEIDSLSNALGRHVHDFSDLNEDLEGMLALMALLDDYIGVSNTNTHLRASVGKIARVLVPNPPDWRWMMNNAPASPWFPGFPIYRQSLQGDWQPALDKLKRDLGTQSA